MNARNRTTSLMRATLLISLFVLILSACGVSKQDLNNAMATQNANTVSLVATMNAGPQSAANPPTIVCQDYDRQTGTTPVTITWTSGATALQVWDSTGFWYWNAPASSPMTISSVDNKGVTPGIVPGRMVTARSTDDFVTFSAQTSIICTLPTQPAGNPTSTPTAQAVENKSAGSNATGTFAKFTPNWNGLSATPPTDDEVLNALGLNRNQLQMFQRESPSWEPALWVIELKPEFYGNVTINMPNGYQLTADTVDYENITFYGGDPAVTTAKLLHGTSVRWMPAYAASDAGKRLLDPALLVALENHFGRCYRNQNSGRADVPYFGRIGPYQTMPGNIYPEWTPPGLDETVVRTNMDAVAMLGGMLENWTIANGNAAWKNPNKGVSGADAQPHYWQQFCVPAITSGYVEIWNVAGQIGPNGVAVSAPGSYKYYSDDLKWLLQWSVDEMTYHSKND